MLCLGWRIMSRCMPACLGSYHYVMSRGILTARWRIMSRCMPACLGNYHYVNT
jgi:hypothetical protein